MGRKISLSEGFCAYDFLSYYKKHISSKYIIRCLACHYIQSGLSYVEVSSLLKFNKNSIVEWIKKFDDGGMELLLSIRPGRGRKARLGKEIKQKFCESVILLQESRSGGRITAADIVEMAKNEYNISYSRSGIYKLLERCGLSWISARSIHPNADIEAQESFKKTFHL